MSYKVIMPNGVEKTFTGANEAEVMGKIDKDLAENYPNF